MPHRMSIIVGLVAAVFTNDTVCVAFTPLILDICRDQDLPIQVCFQSFAKLRS